MSTDTNLDLVRRAVELINQGDFDGAAALYAPDLVSHNAPPGTPPGPAFLVTELAQQREVFPDWHNTIEDLLACGDKVVVRQTFRGTHRGEWRLPYGTLPLTGRPVEFPNVWIYWIADGRIAEAWGAAQWSRAFFQLGATLHRGSPAG